MKRKPLGYIFIAFLFSIIGFYFWGSSPNLPPEKYTSIRSNKESVSMHRSDTIRLMTYNIGYLSGMTNNLAVDRTEALFEENKDLTVSLLDKQGIDVCCVQEVDFNSHRSYNHDQLKEIADAVGYEHTSSTVNWDKKYVPFPYWPPSQQFGKIISGQAVLSVFPIIENERIVLSQADNPFYYNKFYLDRLAQVSKIKVNERELLLINVHLEAWDSLARERQAEQLISLFNQYKNDYPVILLGDFNSTPPGAKNPYMQEKTIEMIKSQPELEMAIHDSVYFKNESAYFTFNSKEPYIRIDYMFYDKRKLKLINSRIVREAREISDHLPLMSDVVFLE